MAKPSVTLVASATPGPRASGEERWYVPVDGNQQRFVDPAGGMPLLHLIRQYPGRATMKVR